MAITAGRSGNAQTTTTSYANMFVSNAEPAGGDGNPVRGMRIIVAEQSAVLEFTGGLADNSDTSLEEITVPAGTNEVFYSFVRNSGRINKIRIKSAVAGAVVTWYPVMS